MARSLKTFVALVLATGILLAASATTAQSETCQSPAHETALHKQGGLYSVTAQINGKKVKLIVDSGAETIILSSSAVERIGLAIIKGPSAPFATTHGTTRLTLLPLETVSVAFLNAQKLVGGVINHDFGDGVDGLLGRSFLNDFIYNINPGAMRLTLYALGCDEEKRGAETQSWWLRRYASLRAPLRKYQSMLALKQTQDAAGHQKTDALIASFSDAELQALVDFYTLQEWRLTQRANAQDIPLEWRNAD